MTVQNQAKHFETWSSQINMWVPAATYSADVDISTGDFRADYGIVATASVNGIQTGMAMTSASNTVLQPTTFVTGYRDKMTPFGRKIQFAGGGAATNAITVLGRDYMGQPIREVITLVAGAATSVKIYKSIDYMSWTLHAAATAVTIGFTDVLGIPYKTVAVQTWLEDGIAATAGTFVAGSNVAQTAATTDPRGSVDFTSASNNVMTFSVIGVADMTNLYGNQHYAG